MQKIVWSSFRKLKTCLPPDSAFALLGIYPSKMKSVYESIVCTFMFIATLFTNAKMEINPDIYLLMIGYRKCSLHTMEYNIVVKKKR